jgi:hypothetical protein
MQNLFVLSSGKSLLVMFATIPFALYPLNFYPLDLSG